MCMYFFFPRKCFLCMGIQKANHMVMKNQVKQGDDPG